MGARDERVAREMFTRYNLLRCLAMLLALALVLVARDLPRNPRREPLRVAVSLWPGVESLILARERGLLPEDQFQILEVTWTSAVNRAFDNGVVDAAVLSLDGVLRLQGSGEKLRVIFVMDVSQGADVVLAGTGISKLEDLRGVKVGVDVRGAGMTLLVSALEGAGMKPEDVEIVPLLQPEMEAAFQQGDVQAVVVSEPWMTGLIAKGGRILADSNSVSPPIYRALVVREAAFVDRRDELVKLLRAHIDMLPLLRAGNAMDEIDAVCRREGLTREEFSAALGRVRLLDLAENRLLLGSGEGSITGVITQIGESMTGTGNGEVTARASDWIDDSIIREIRP